ncbi:Methenyltetrahydrofolate cyclohydrolase [Alicyclobacillus hesperidum URH17-3-68]|uniref:bifunctional methylenetetrahydrofolate dehydrogenase/methenyltetrahydrofolate cyclohydrolase n=1 Tax=Alicyclobacillus hesperidum TaxID=89784 RepID=UPI000281B029|nr:bifunctional methylenetetrahydrofolate dehydrogenase/methenyltetrahydrofolate cyclohydrolase [Alicyclobacillus hesperidum]EJY55912.1 Methenyltetrahydrofolate cyclohydrolase [Alicyclobacillus hesperidum URH17-3-68]
MTQIIDGKQVAAEVKRDVGERVQRLRGQGVVPGLTLVLVGDDAASASYVRSKRKLAMDLRLHAVIRELPADVEESELLQIIGQLNEDDSVDAILVQLPLPPHLNAERVLEAIAPEKDVDGLHPINLGLTSRGAPSVWPCTAAGIARLLDFTGVPIAGQTAVVVGRSRLVGWPTAQWLLSRGATVVQCHRQTVNLPTYTRQADVLVVAAGVPHLIGKEHVKPGATVIDVGMNRVDGRLIGDVDFAHVAPLVSAITPVPGGVGPMTVAMLVANAVSLCEQRRGMRGDVDE